jgi:hypothetical protein
MNGRASSFGQPALHNPIVTWLGKVPLWTIVVFSAAVAFAYSPNVLQVFGIHNNYEMLYFWRPQFLFPDVEQLFTTGRPVAALLTNLTVLPVHSLADIRWMRIFSLLTVCLIGTQMMANCILLLRTRARDAVAVAVSLFLVLAFIYSVLDPSAWVAHLLSLLLVFLAYTILGRSNLQSIPFLVLARRRDWRAFVRQAWTYAVTGPVWLACLVFQVALYDYPPYALMIVVFPVIAVLFSQTPQAYRTLLAVRDIIFVGINLVLFSLSAKLIYFPIVRLFSSLNTAAAPDASGNPFLSRVGQTYRFDFNLDAGEILARLGRLMKVVGDLWFLPQSEFHVFAGAVILLAVVLPVSLTLLARGGLRLQAIETSTDMARLTPDSWNSGFMVTTVVVAACLAISAVTVVLPVGGILVYRTAVVPTAVVAIVFLFSLRVIAEIAWKMIGNPLPGAARIADGAMALAVCAAIAANFSSNRLTLKLARSEFAYFTAMVRQAIADKSSTIILVDPRPLSLPEDHPVMYDQKGRAVPPYELGCFSGYCLQTGSVVHIAASELGVSDEQLKVFVQRENDPVPGLTCEILTAPRPTYPQGASERSIALINYFRRIAPISCVTYSLDWHDLGAGG